MAKSQSSSRPRVRDLEQQIRYHQGLYYNGDPEITDAQFDALWDELKELDPSNILFNTINSEFTDGFPKEYHLIPMGSQEKAADAESFSVWAASCGFDEFLVQYKLDGASLELQYEKGILTHAVTRGDGTIGDDITANAQKMKGVLAFLPDPWGPASRTPFSGGIRGEVIMEKTVLATYFPDKANCRNAANGLMKRKDGNGCEHLRVVCYDAASGTPGQPFSGYTPFNDEEEKIRWLSTCGFDTVPMNICLGSQAVIDYRAHITDIRATLPYDIDGLVVKGRRIDPVDLARSRPQLQIAFKFNLEEAITVLRAVEWSESGITYTPIGITDPVKLAGTTVQRANLVNPRMIEDMHLRIGSRVILTKRGEIIPKIEGLVENPPDTSAIEIPHICTSCSTALVNEGTRLYCPNPRCPKVIHHRISKWLTVLDVRDFGDALIQQLFASSRVRSISDLYTLTVEELASLERMGEKSASKVLKALDSRRDLRLSQFIAGFDIDGIGETMVDKLIAAGFTSLESLLSAKETDFAQVYQFGDILARSLRAGLDELGPQMRSLVASNTIRIQEVEDSGGLSGVSFCFTGELTTLTRSRAEQLVKDSGGSVKSAPVKGLSYLVTNDPQSSSSKTRKARELGIPFIDEEGFLKMLGREAGVEEVR